MTIGLDAQPEMESFEPPTLSDAVDSPFRSEKFVTFQLGENLYGVYAPAIAEVMHPSPLTLLPNAPASLMGVAPLRGEVIALVDLRSLVGEAASRNSSTKEKQLVLKRATDDSISIAFVVDRLGEIVTLPTSSIRRTGGTKPMIAGECTLNDRSFRIIDHTKALSVVDPVLSS